MTITSVYPSFIPFIPFYPYQGGYLPLARGTVTGRRRLPRVLSAEPHPPGASIPEYPYLSVICFWIFYPSPSAGGMSNGTLHPDAKTTKQRAIEARGAWAATATGPELTE